VCSCYLGGKLGRGVVGGDWKFAPFPQQEHTRYLVVSGLNALAEQVRVQAGAVGVTQVSDLIAVIAGGNGLEEALERNLAENLTTMLDWSHAAEHICAFAKVVHARDEEACVQWQNQAKGILYEQGGEVLLTYLQSLPLPSRTSAAGCKIISERLKGLGMRWVEDGAAPGASLRVLYVSGGKVWDGLWSPPRRRAT
jgi:hypothetical protein